MAFELATYGAVAGSIYNYENYLWCGTHALEFNFGELGTQSTN